MSTTKTKKSDEGGDWLARYERYASYITESPHIFHRWIGLWLLASTLSRRVWLTFRGRPIYPNLYVIIVGPSARVQKSSSANVAVDLMDQFLDRVVLFRDRVTRAYLTDYMSEAAKRIGHSSITIFAPELRTALNEMTIKDGILEILTAVYDCPPKIEYRLKYGGVKIAEEPCINFLGCSTRQWLTIGLKADEVGAGFAGRLVAIYSEDPLTPRPYERSVDITHDDRGYVVQWLKTLQSLEGEMVMSPEAGDLWSSFRAAQVAQSPEKDARIRAFHDRKHGLALKLGMLCAVSRHTELVIEERDMYKAILMLEEAEQFVSEALKSVSGTHITTHIDSVIEVLREHHGSIARTKLIRVLHNRRYGLASRDLDQVIMTLKDMGVLGVRMVSHVPGKKPVTVYTLLEGGTKDND